MLKNWRYWVVGGLAGFNLGQGLHVGKTIPAIGFETDDKQFYSAKNVSWCQIHSAYHVSQDYDQLFEHLGHADDPEVKATYNTRAQQQRTQALPTVPWFDLTNRNATFTTKRELTNYLKHSFLKWQENKQEKASE